MRRATSLCTILFLTLATQRAWAQAQNDECFNAIQVTVGQNGPFDTHNATTSQPAWPCGQGGNDVWFWYQTGCSGTLEVQTCALANFDTTVEIFDGSCSALTSLGCNDDQCGLQSLLSVPVQQGSVYFVRIGGYQGARGDFSLLVNCLPQQPPVLVSIAPGTIGAGSGAFQITLDGAYFGPTTVAEWDGLPLPTTLVSATQMLATVSASLVATHRYASITAHTPGVGQSGAFTFTVTAPVPVLTVTTPSSATAGGGGFTLTATGVGFQPDSVVLWNGQSLQTTYVSSNQLRSTVLSSHLCNNGAATITVSTPPPGGGLSQGRSFSINAAVPVLTSISPTSGIGGTSVTLTIRGANFVPSSVPQLNGVPLTYSYDCLNRLIRADIPGSLTCSNGVRQVTVTTPGVGTSGSLPFTVNATPPVASTLVPNAISVGSPAFTLQVLGSAFTCTSQALWNGQALATQFVNAGRLDVALSAAFSQSAGTVAVSVRTPPPGGGLTQNLTFTITNRAPVLGTIGQPVLVRGDPAFTMTVRGSEFESVSVVRWGQTSLTTRRDSATQLSADVPASLMTSAGPVDLTVFTPGPGGGTSEVRRARVFDPHAVEVHSVNDAGQAADADIQDAVVSSNARFVAFASSARNLVQRPTSRLQVFAYDRVERRIAHVSATTSGQAIDGDCTQPSLSADGRYVLFVSADRLQSVPRIYRVDRDVDNDGVFDEVGQIELIQLSLTSAGSPANAPCGATAQAISSDGTRAVFTSTATNLVPGVTDRLSHCYVRDVVTGTTFLASADAAGRIGNGPSFLPTISGDGRYVAFHTDATNLFAGDTNNASDVVRKLVVNGSIGAVDLVSRASGVAGAQANGASSHGVISGTGQFVSYQTAATNLGATDTNDATDVFRYDFGSTTTRLISFALSGATGNGASYYPAITLTGCTMFVSDASDLSVTDTNRLPDAYGWDSRRPSYPHRPLSMYNYPAGQMGTGASGLRGLSVATDARFVVLGTAATSLAMSIPGLYLTPYSSYAFGVVMPFAVVAPSPGPDDNPVTFSVDGPVHAQTTGLAFARGTGSSAPFATRTPPAAQAQGVATARPGDVNDYFVASLPSEAELFQSEPDVPGAAPAGTSNQIIIAARAGLVAARPTATWRDNIDALSFGEDFFGVRDVNENAGPGRATRWQQRRGSFTQPIVTLDIGTSFRFSVDPYAIGLPATALIVESLGLDTGSGSGPWTSPGAAAGDVFATPTLTLPTPPAPGLNTLVHDNPALSLVPPGAPIAAREDDIDALECVGDNDPASWSGVGPAAVQPGNLRARVEETVPGLGAPAVAHHALTIAPVFFSVDRNSTGLALSAARTQWLAGEAAADVFMAWGGTNYLLIDETELGLYQGSGTADPTDELDALVLKVHPGDRARLLQLAAQALQQSRIIDPTPQQPNSGDEYREGDGFDRSLLQMTRTNPIRMRVGFSVSTDSIGLERTAVDFQAGLKPTMEQAGDVFFTQFGVWDDAPGIINSAPMSALGTHWLWYEEVQLGMSAGAWTLPAPVGTSLALLPDELNGMDTICTAPSYGGRLSSYGTPCPGTGGYAPILTPTGWAHGGRSVGITLHNGLGSSQAFLVIGTAPGTFYFAGFTRQWPFYVDPLTMITVLPIPLSGGGAGQGALALRLPIASHLQSLTLAMQALVLDPNGATGLGLSTTNGIELRIE